MKRLLVLFALLLSSPAMAQIPGGSEIQIGRTPITQGTNGLCLYQSNGKVAEQACGLVTMLQLLPITVPASPVSGVILFFDQADSHVKILFSSGNLIDLGGSP